MDKKEAIKTPKSILGKCLYPNAIPKVEEILRKLEEDSFEAGFEEARDTVGDWYEPDYEHNEGYD